MPNNTQTHSRVDSVIQSANDTFHGVADSIRNVPGKVADAFHNAASKVEVETRTVSNDINNKSFLDTSAWNPIAKVVTIYGHTYDYKLISHAIDALPLSLNGTSYGFGKATGVSYLLGSAAEAFYTVKAAWNLQGREVLKHAGDAALDAIIGAGVIFAGEAIQANNSAVIFNESVPAITISDAVTTGMQATSAILGVAGAYDLYTQHQAQDF